MGDCNHGPTRTDALCVSEFELIGDFDPQTLEAALLEIRYLVRSAGGEIISSVVEDLEADCASESPAKGGETDGQHTTVR